LRKSWGDVMKNLVMLCLAVGLAAAGCGGPSPAQEHFRDVVAVELALATLADGASPTPSPYSCARCRDTGWLTHGDGHRTPCPDCNPGAAGELYGGPIDTVREVKELIRKGNELADRGTAILDAAERDGKVTIDIRLPKPTPLRASAACTEGACPVPGPQAQRPAASPCAAGVCYVPSRPRLFGRRR